MALRWSEKEKNLIDERCPSDKIFHVQAVSVAYTLQSDDITKGEKPDCTPYASREDALILQDDATFLGTATNAVLKTETYGCGVKFLLTSDSDELSEFGINLPFNFMGKVNGGGWKNQFLFNSPYLSEDRKIFYVYLTKENGNPIMLAANGVAGWKMDYSTYVGGHYFVNLKLFANFDKAFKRPRRKNDLEWILLPVKDFQDGLAKLSEYYGVPFLDIDKNGGKIGDKVALKVFGQCDSIVYRQGEETQALSPFEEIPLRKSGEITIIPYNGDKKGAAVTLYAYDSLLKLYKRSMDSVDLSVVEKYTDGNLCEHQSWCLAMLRFLLKYRANLTKEEIRIYEGKILSLMSVITEKDPKKAVFRRTILNQPYEDFPAYNIFKSRRIQEEFFGISILLDAYKYFRNEEYLEYAVKTTDSLIANYQAENGGLLRESECGIEDYTTVCAPMIPIADMYLFLKTRGDAHAEYYREAAKKMAEFLYRRGLNFPTEGGETSENAEPEMEDGSISCTALNLLYYCAKIERDERYIRKAKEILDIHEAWVIKTPICQMHGSSLRWWETRWEGDADGPAICAGHAWTIWRAEADYWYAYLMGDEAYYKKSFNGFMTNFSKIDKDGKSYSIYNVDDINGGGFAKKSDDISFKISEKYAKIEDCGLSRYVWSRALDTLFRKDE